LSDKRQAELESWLDRWGLDPTGPTIDWRREFGVADTSAEVPVVLDIGFGHGESTIALAREQSDRFVVGVEVHTPGVVTVLDAVEHDPLPHVRVVHGDVLRFLTRVTANSLVGVRIFFPDPWPKQKQHHRRLVRPDVVAVLTDRLQVGGVLHLATDIVHYADAMRVACDGESRLSGGVVERPPWRPRTRFEQRGIDEGRPAVDLMYTRTS
jgi:tRNA (guanine-N7-)-methyltransferase